MVEIGIIGCGKIAENHIRAFKELNIDPVVADINPDASTFLAEKYDLTKVEDPKDIFRSDSINIVDLCIPTALHYENIIEGIKSGKHVFCEKPLCDSLRNAYEIKGAVMNSSSMLMVGYLYRFHSAMQNAHKIIHDGMLGDIHAAYLRLGARGEHRYWKHRKAEGGGVINECLVHMIDLALWFFGSFTDASLVNKEIILPYRNIDNIKAETDVEDFALVRMEFEKTIAFCQSDFLSPGYMNIIELHGDNGSLLTSILDYLPTRLFLKKPAGDYEAGQHIIHFKPENIIKAELSCFLEGIENKEIELNSILDSIKIIEVLEKIR